MQGPVPPRIPDGRLEKRLLRQVGGAIAKYRLIEDADRVLVCVSGGKDSFTLLYLLQKLQRSAPIRFELLACNLDQRHPGFPAAALEAYLRAQDVPVLMLREDTYSVVKRLVPEGKTACALADGFYIGRQLLHGLPEQVHVIGPVHPKASISPPRGPTADRRGKVGDALPTPTEMLDNPEYLSDELLLPLPKGGHKRLVVKVVKGVCWYPAAGQRKIQLVLVRDPAKQWRDELLLSTDLRLSASEVILGYMRRWSVEVCYWESKELLGLHEAQVWTELAVQRVHPMAWFVGGLVLVWYARYGQEEKQARWDRPWYDKKVGPTFADMLATMRLHLWRHAWEEAEPDDQAEVAQKRSLRYPVTRERGGRRGGSRPPHLA